MDKSKQKRENPFSDYLWQTEELLWMGQPLWQSWTQVNDLAAHQLFSGISRKVKIIIISMVLVLITLMFTGKLAANQEMFFMSLILLCLMPILSYFMLRFANIANSDETIFYAITNRRILVLIDKRFHEMPYEVILMIRINQVKEYQTLIWDEGQVGFFPPFIGIEDAQYLVHLVEQAQNKNIPIVHKSWRNTMIFD